jgi:hypothetical protein
MCFSISFLSSFLNILHVLRIIASIMDGFMNNKGFVVACLLNHCLLSKQSLSVCIKDFCTMDVLPFVIFSMLLLIIIYLFV